MANIWNLSDHKTPSGKKIMSASDYSTNDLLSGVYTHGKPFPLPNKLPNSGEALAGAYGTASNCSIPNNEKDLDKIIEKYKSVVYYDAGNGVTMPSTEEIEINEQGGKQSKLNVRFDLLHFIPAYCLTVMGHILETGATKYGIDNWQLISTEDHINHAINHLYLYLKSDTSENHLGNACCRCVFALYMANKSCL